MSIHKTPEQIKKMHTDLEGLLTEFGTHAHRYMDRIIESSFIDDRCEMLQESDMALAQTVMKIECSRCKYGPRNGQKQWKEEVEIVKRGLK